MLVCVAGAGGFEPPHGEIKIDRKRKRFNVCLDFSRDVRGKQVQSVSLSV